MPLARWRLYRAGRSTGLRGSVLKPWDGSNRAWNGIYRYVVYRLKDSVKSRSGQAHMTHNGFGLQTPDGEEINNKTITFQPGVKDLSICLDGVTVRIYNSSRDMADHRRRRRSGDNVQEVVVPRAVKTNLSVKITEYPGKALEGQAVHMVALVESNTDELIHTNIEWKVNGVRHHYSDDLIFKTHENLRSPSPCLLGTPC